MGIIGGYRVVRRLGVGSRAEVWLGRSTDAAPLVALKVYRAHCDPQGVDREISALARIDSPHVLELLDTATDDLRPCLVVPRLDAGGLARLLAERPVLSRGEIVTLLVPIAQAVLAMHLAGVVHGDLRPGKVLFDGRGAPVVVTGGGTRLFDTAPPPAVQRDDAGLRSDRQQLCRLAATLVARADKDHETLAQLAGWLEGDCWEQPDFAKDLVEACFSLAEPMPLQLPWQVEGGPWADYEPQPPARPALARSGGATPRAAAGTPSPRGRGAVLRAGAALAASSPALALRRAWGAVCGVRLRFRVLAVACLLAVGGTVATLVVQSGGGVPPAPGGAEGGAVAPVPSVPASGEPHGDAAADGGHAEEDQAEPETRASDDAVLTGDDPVAAARVLLATREKCLTALSLQCLGAVVQRDSAAWDADAARVAGLRDGSRSQATTWREEWSVEVVDTMGAVVLLETHGGDDPEDAAGQTTPASVLIIRTEAGWRIRDVFAG